jgi:DNA-binding protein YbaB
MAAQRDLLRDMDERFSSTSAHATSPDESVSVEVGGLGVMTALWLAPTALEQGPDALAKLIVDTAASAAQRALDSQESLIKELNHGTCAVRQGPRILGYGTTIAAP